MENEILLGVIVLIVVGAIGAMVKRAGRKGCCGSAGDYKPRKKRLKNVIATKVFTVDGMHCEKCANRVTEVVNDIPGVAGVVNLKKESSQFLMSRRFLTSRSRQRSNAWVTPLRKSDKNNGQLSADRFPLPAKSPEQRCHASLLRMLFFAYF